jgi:hypothetical protein
LFVSAPNFTVSAPILCHPYGSFLDNNHVIKSLNLFMSICYPRCCTVRPLGALWRLTAGVPSLFLTAGATQPFPDGWSTSPTEVLRPYCFPTCQFFPRTNFPLVQLLSYNFPESSPSSKSASRLGCFLTLAGLSIEIKKNRLWHKSTSTTYKNKVRKIRETKDNLHDTWLEFESRKVLNFLRAVPVVLDYTQNRKRISKCGVKILTKFY